MNSWFLEKPLPVTSSTATLRYCQLPAIVYSVRILLIPFFRP